MLPANAKIMQENFWSGHKKGSSEIRKSLFLYQLITYFSTV